MITELQTQPFQSSVSWKGLWRGQFILIPLSLLMLAGRADAQQIRVIQAPAPYNACNVRSQAGIQYSVVGTFRNGQAVTLLGESGRGWYRVQVGQTIGWMARQCLGL